MFFFFAIHFFFQFTMCNIPTFNRRIQQLPMIFISFNILFKDIITFSTSFQFIFFPVFYHIWTRNYIKIRQCRSTFNFKFFIIYHKYNIVVIFCLHITYGNRIIFTNRFYINRDSSFIIPHYPNINTFLISHCYISLIIQPIQHGQHQILTSNSSIKAVLFSRHNPNICSY